ncbi:hypothetical protein [Bradyrhizobium viridifuturi]|uniref:hypothetical protein n=1 Tax=Bradyrhizobium viridifuturi TaxID=1654716 RepID=UPI00067E820C|nr:hypothetical protein [Bradyrhizobium viridifuturi]
MTVPDQEIHDAQEEGFANLIQLRQFPDTLYVAPALCHTRHGAWAALNQGGSGQPGDYVPGAWTIYEDNLYSLVAPEASRLKSIIDVGRIDRLETCEWALSENDLRRRRFVQLLNGALRDDLWGHGVR